MVSKMNLIDLVRKLYDILRQKIAPVIDPLVKKIN